MKSKIIVSIFASIFLLSLVLATVSIGTSTVTLSGSDRSEVFTLTNDNTGAVSGTIPSIAIDDGNGNNVLVNLNQSSFNLANGASVNINASISSIPADFSLGTFSRTVQINLSNNQSLPLTVSFDNSYCEFGTVGDLDISVDIQNTGNGEDDEWYLLDEIEVDVDVENNGDDDDDGEDVIVEWGLYNQRTGEFIIDEEEDLGNVDKGDEETVSFTFTVEPDEFDEDDNEDDFVFVVKAYSDSSDNGEDVQCDSSSEDIKVLLDDEFAIITDIQLSESVSPGERVTGSADVWNVGNEDLDDVTVLIENGNLGIKQVVEVGDIDALDSQSIDFQFNIPSSAKAGSYPLKFSVLDEDEDVFENDNDDESTETIVLQIGGTATDGDDDSDDDDTSNVRISASLESDAVAGKEFSVRATITNLGDSEEDYQVVVTNYNSWASLSSVEPRSLTLDAGDSENVIIKLVANSDVDTNQEFVIQVIASGKVTEQRINVPVEARSSGGFGITGGAIGASIRANWVIWLIGAINVILVILIIVVAVRMARK